MKYPDYLFPGVADGFMSVPKPYQEFLVRWYYYDTSDDTEIPPTVPVENIEEYVATRMNPPNVWVAKGFAIARNVDAGDNLDFKNDGEFHIFCIFVAKMYFKYAVLNNWMDANITKEDFIETCNALKGIHI